MKGVSLLGPSLESKFDELRYEIVNKIEKELLTSQNERDFTFQKYDELCARVNCIKELDASISEFRNDVKVIERQISELTRRVDEIDKRTIHCKPSFSITSSVLWSFNEHLKLLVCEFSITFNINTLLTLCVFFVFWGALQIYK